jgi:hopanoid biosynthesis associated protein HpnK
MVTGDAAADAVVQARAHPRLAVGLHLVLAQARAAAPTRAVRRLVRADGTFGDDPIVAGLRCAWAWCSAVGRAQLERELRAQLDAFRATGLPLAHVDGHLNMHLHPMILPIVVRLAPEYGIRAVRLSREDLRPALRHDRRHLVRKGFEHVVFRTLARLAAPRLRAAGILSADRVYGMHQTGHVDEAYLLGVLAALPPGTSEVYGHPALGASAMARWQHGYDPAGEVAAFTSPRVRAAVDAAGVDLVSYRDL